MRSLCRIHASPSLVDALVNEAERGFLARRMPRRCPPAGGAVEWLVDVGSVDPSRNDRHREDDRGDEYRSRDGPRATSSVLAATRVRDDRGEHEGRQADNDEPPHARDATERSWAQAVNPTA
jgi:hypothetical protein